MITLTILNWFMTSQGIFTGAFLVLFVSGLFFRLIRG